MALVRKLIRSPKTKIDQQFLQFPCSDRYRRCLDELTSQASWISKNSKKKQFSSFDITLLFLSSKEEGRHSLRLQFSYIWTITSPAITTTNPAPADKYTSIMGSTKSVGTPFRLGFPLNDNAVFATQTGNSP